MTTVIAASLVHVLLPYAAATVCPSSSDFASSNVNAWAEDFRPMWPRNWEERLLEQERERVAAGRRVDDGETVLNALSTPVVAVPRNPMFLISPSRTFQDQTLAARLVPIRKGNTIELLPVGEPADRRGFVPPDALPAKGEWWLEVSETGGWTLVEWDPAWSPDVWRTVVVTSARVDRRPPNVSYDGARLVQERELDETFVRCTNDGPLLEIAVSRAEDDQTPTELLVFAIWFSRPDDALDWRAPPDALVRARDGQILIGRHCGCGRRFRIALPEAATVGRQIGVRALDLAGNASPPVTLVIDKAP